MQHSSSRRQPGQHPYSRNREPNPFFEKVEAPRHDPKLALRSSNLNLMMTAAGIDKIKLAEALEMNIARVGEYLEGTRDFNEDVAKHVEEQLGLEPKFLDNRHQTLELSEKTLKILRGEVVKSEEEDSDYPTHAPQTSAHTHGHGQGPALAVVGSAPEAKAQHVVETQAAEQQTVGEVAEEPATAQSVQEVEAPRMHVVAAAQPRVEPVETVVPTVATRRPKVQKHSEVVIHSMAQPTQEKEVTDMSITEEAMAERRRGNFNILAAGKGAKAAIAKVMDVSAGHITLLVQGNRTITAELARDIETYFGLDEGWMDHKPTANREIPQVALLAIHNRTAVAHPVHEEDNKPRRGRPRGSKNAATLEREAAEAVAAPAAPKRGRRPGTAKAAAAPEKTAQTELALAESQAAAPAPAPAAAPAAEKRHKAPAATHAAKPTAAPAAAKPVAGHPVLHVTGTHEAQALPGLDESGMEPVAVALLRLLVQKANEGKLGNEQALKFLPEIMAL